MCAPVVAVRLKAMPPTKRSPEVSQSRSGSPAEVSTPKSGEARPAALVSPG